MPVVPFRTVMIRNFDPVLWTVIRTEARRRRWSTALVVDHFVRLGMRAEKEGTQHDDSLARRAS